MNKTVNTEAEMPDFNVVTKKTCAARLVGLRALRVPRLDRLSIRLVATGGKQT